MSTSRKLAAVYFADLVGYSELSSRDEAAALRLVDMLQGVARREVGAQNGRIVKFVGDEVVAEFSSGEAAVRSADGLLRSLGRACGRDQCLRIGIHLGDLTVAADGDIYGDSVNIAARLQRLAEPGQIVISEDLWRLLRRNRDFSFEPLGTHELKGMAEPIDAFHVVCTTQQCAPMAVPAQAVTVGPAPRKRLIVLPFRALRQDEETDFLRFGLADAITCSLSNVSSLTLRSAATAMKLAEAEDDPRLIGERADVDLVLIGTLLRIGNRMRVAAQLADARDGSVLWSQQENVTLDDLFQLQDALAMRIVESLALPLTVGEQKTLRHDVPASTAAYEHYLRANHLAYERSEWLLALDLYRTAVAEDPNYAPAWARLGRCSRLVGKYVRTGLERESFFHEAERAFQRALELNPQLALAHKLYSQMEVDLGRARGAVLRLTELARAHGGDAEIYAGLVHALRYCGLLEESVAAHGRARSLDPRIRTSVDYTHFARGDYKAALREAEPDQIAYLRASTLVMLGHVDEAIRELTVNPDPIRTGSPQKALRALLLGDLDNAFAEDVVAFARNFPDPEGRYLQARNFAYAGRTEQVLPLLEDIVRWGYCVPQLLRGDPWLAALQGEPRLEQLIEVAERESEQARLAFERIGGLAMLEAEPESLAQGHPPATP